MIRRPPRSTLDRSSAASDVYKRQPMAYVSEVVTIAFIYVYLLGAAALYARNEDLVLDLSLIHISEPTRPY